MKIPFDIKFRPQIESGEYKVETRDGRTARIICWNRKDDNRPIVALVENYKEQEIMHLFNLNGRVLEHYTSDSDLFIVTPEPELTEFEEAIEGYIKSYTGIVQTDVAAKQWAAELLELAKKELCNGCNANLEGYIKGREDARKEMEYKHAYWPPCHYGGQRTNPFRDCINCPRQSTIGITTTTGTSTSKVEG